MDNKKLKKKMTLVAKGKLTMKEAMKDMEKPKKRVQSGSKQGKSITKTNAQEENKCHKEVK